MLNSTERGDADDTWLVTHEALASFAKKRAGLDFEEGCLLRAARQAEVHRQLGYGSFAEYVERLFGYAPRVTHDKLRVAEVLEGLPALSRELREGTLSYSHARELTRVATAETEEIWLQHARGRTSREVEKPSPVVVPAHGQIRRSRRRSSGTCCASTCPAKRWPPSARQ